MSGAGGLPLPARVFVAVVVVPGLVLLAVRVPEALRWSPGELFGALLLAAAVAVADQFTVEIPHADEKEHFALTDAMWVAGIMLAPGSVVVAGVALGTLLAQTTQQWAAHKVAFNVAQVVIAITAAEQLYGALGPGSPSEPPAWAAATVAMVVCHLINAGTVAMVIALARRDSFRRVLLGPIRVDILHWTGNVATGILAAVVWDANPAAVLILLLPLTLLYWAYRGWVASLRHQEEMTAMAATADVIAREWDLAKRLPEPGGQDATAALAQTLNRMLARLETAFDRERRFIREASHELRTPVTISRGHLEVLDDGSDLDEMRQAVDVVLDELRRISRLLDDMTTLARVDHPRFLSPEPIELDGFLADVAVKAVPLLNGRLRTQAPPPGAVATADPQRLTQALLNLLQNAAVHGRGDTPVDLRVVAEPEAWRFEVDDHGGGIRPGEEELIFRSFARGETSASGSGLGLAIVRSIAGVHGGAAGVDNRPGEGARFWVRVPR